jgi:hypothetical protein
MTQELVYHIMTLDFDTAKTVPQEERFPQLLEHAEVNNGITMFKGTCVEACCSFVSNWVMFV